MVLRLCKLGRCGSVEAARAVAEFLRRGGFYAARHSSSILVMYGGRVVGSVHVYGGECRVRVNLVAGGELARRVSSRLVEAAERVCGSVAVEEVVEER